MKYFVELGGAEHAVDVTRTPEGLFRASVAGKDVPVDVVSIDAASVLIKVGTRVFDLVLEGTLPTPRVTVGTHRGVVNIHSERARAVSGGASAASVREKDVRSPMPGRVVKVLVAVGDEVGAGQAVAIVEAMKMENEVRAVKGGVIAKIHVAAGGAVEGQGILVSFETK